MLDDPTAEREVLGDIGWQRNEVVLHSDRACRGARLGELELPAERAGAGQRLCDLQHEHSAGAACGQRCSASP
jgi:hypothetical protein